jgi:hypothetical protein
VYGKSIPAVFPFNGKSVKKKIILNKLKCVIGVAALLQNTSLLPHFALSHKSSPVRIGVPFATCRAAGRCGRPVDFFFQFFSPLRCPLAVESKSELDTVHHQHARPYIL